MSRKEALRQQYLAGLCSVLREFVLAGHELHVRTEHGRASTDNQIVFDIPDWEAFANLLEDVPAAAR
ncbi:MAG: hypothetical protein O2822_09265 [Chloroflexi bacterium]|nr:hypothetical protein [Chloroflexota bacterium]